MKDEILENLLDAIEIYFLLTERMTTGIIHICKDSKDAEPGLNYYLMREDIYKHILDISRELPCL